MKLAYLSGCLALLMVTTAMAEDTPIPLFDFTGADSAKEWQTVNDGVMGGVSEGKFKITDTKTMEFLGTLSLANNGGFASVRTKAKRLGLEKGDTLVAKVKGDGREYHMNLSVPTFQIAYNYRAVFQTKKDEWIEVDLPPLNSTTFRERIWWCENQRRAFNATRKERTGRADHPLCCECRSRGGAR